MKCCINTRLKSMCDHCVELDLEMKAQNCLSAFKIRGCDKLIFLYTFEFDHCYHTSSIIVYCS